MQTNLVQSINKYMSFIFIIFCHHNPLSPVIVFIIIFLFFFIMRSCIFSLHFFNFNLPQDRTALDSLYGIEIIITIRIKMTGL